MWYNATTRQLQSNPPWSGWVSEDIKQLQYADWQEVANDFIMPKDLTEEKTNKRSEINAAKDDAEAASPFIYMEKPFDFDPLSRERLNVAIQLAQSLKIAGVGGQNKVTDWKLADNSLAEMTVDMLCAMPQAFAQRSAELHVKAWGLKAQVEAATTTQELDAIVW